MRLSLALIFALSLLLDLGACAAEPSPFPTVPISSAQPSPTSSPAVIASPIPTVLVPSAQPSPTPLPARTETGPLPAPSTVASPTPEVSHFSASLVCKSSGPEVYLVVGAVRRHIVDWDTFLNLGYEAEEIAPCPAGVSLSDGAPLTRLLKGSGDAVYWMEDGSRRHIPDMATFSARGYHIQDIAVVPDDLLVSWPLGDPLSSTSILSASPTFSPTAAANATAGPGAGLRRELEIGRYTIRQWRPLSGSGMYDWATISAPGQPDIKIDFVQDIGTLPAPDITGAGEPAVLFDLYEGGSHCCWGTIIYTLGSTPRKILDIMSTFEYYESTGRGELVDLDGDGLYEFVTADPLNQLPCSEPSVRVVLRYDPVQGRYVGASPRYPAVYAQDLIRDTRLAEKNRAESQNGYKCGVYPIVVDYLYRGQVDKARAELQRLYLGSDLDAFWNQLQASVDQGRFFVPATAP